MAGVATVLVSLAGVATVVAGVVASLAGVLLRVHTARQFDR